MSTYTPPTINDGDAFDPETIKDGFDDFGTAINAAVDTNNIVASQLEVQQFHKEQTQIVKVIQVIILYLAQSHQMAVVMVLVMEQVPTVVQVAVMDMVDLEQVVQVTHLQ